jgi:hypothetical protein
MKNKLHLIQRTARLTCIWVPTSDARNPLACVWNAAKTPMATSAVTVNSEETRLHLCA